MKKTFLRLSALILALIMALTVLGSCNDNKENVVTTTKPDDSTVTEHIQSTVI